MKLKIFRYIFVKSLETREEIDDTTQELFIYAFNRKQANDIATLFLKKKKYINHTFIGMKTSREEINRLNRFVERFGSEEAVIEKQYEIVRG